MSERQQRILIVEDDARLRVALTLKLKQEGYDVQLAADGEEGLTAAAAERPDLILLDLMMPKLNGRDMLHILRSHSWGRRIPVIVLTNDSSMRSVNATLKDNAPAYFIKSDISLKEIVEAIRYHLRAGAAA